MNNEQGFTMPERRLICGDSASMADLARDSIDALVTDPPAGIAFMDTDWDRFRRADNPNDVGRNDVFGRTSRTSPASGAEGQRRSFIAALQPVFEEALRVMKPGAHGLVWALPRTSHWTACALEDAGFEIRDCIQHLFGTGFPKSLDVSKAIDKSLGVKGTLGEAKSEAHAGWIARGRMRGTEGHEGWQSGWMSDPERVDANARTYIGGSDAAKEWSGWGTALKPSAEFWWLIRKPCSEKTVAANVLRWGTGALNIDASRIGSDLVHTNHTKLQGDSYNWTANKSTGERSAHVGRWPAHTLFSHNDDCAEECSEGCAVAMLAGQSGQSTGYKRQGRAGNRAGGVYDIGSANGSAKPNGPLYADGGNASRFFYCAKPSTSEKNANVPDRNTHPTVKSIALMRYLIRLVTPPNGTVIDCFAGSGTTLVAAESLGFGWVGYEREPEYVAIARARLDLAVRR
jgi:DNA modification methylase